MDSNGSEARPSTVNVDRWIMRMGCEKLPQNKKYMKDIKDFLKYYIGQKARVKGFEEDPILTGISYDDTQREWWAYFENTEIGYALVSDVKPLLRRLDSMTEEEATEGKMWAVWHDVNLMGQEWKRESFYPEQFNYMLSKGFDLFNLIDDNLAIDINLPTP